MVRSESNTVAPNAEFQVGSVIAIADRAFGSSIGARVTAFGGAELLPLRSISSDVLETVETLCRDSVAAPNWRERVVLSCRKPIDEMLQRPHSMVKRLRSRVPLRSVRELDERCLATLAMRSGRSVRDKLAQDPNCLAVRREFSSDLIEFDVTRRLFDRLSNGSFDDDGFGLRSEFATWLRASRQHPLIVNCTSRSQIRPSNRLLRDRNSSLIWRAYLELRAADEVIRDWKTRARSIELEFIRLLVIGCYGGKILHSEPTVVRVDLTRLESCRGPIELVVRTSLTTSRRVHFGSVAPTGETEYQFSVAGEVHIDVALRQGEAQLSSLGVVLDSIPIANPESLVRVADEIARHVLPAGILTPRVHRARGDAVAVDLCGKLVATCAIANHQSPALTVQPLQAANVSNTSGEQTWVGGICAIGATAFVETSPSKVCSVCDVSCGESDATRAMLSAVAFKPSTLALITDDKFDPVRDSALMAALPAVERGAVLLPAAVCALEAKGLLRVLKDRSPGDCVAVVTIGEKVQVSWLSVEAESSESLVWIRQPAVELEGVDFTLDLADELESWVPNADEEGAWCVADREVAVDRTEQFGSGGRRIGDLLQTVRATELHQRAMALLWVDHRRISIAEQSVATIAKAIGAAEHHRISRDDQLIVAAANLGRDLLARSGGVAPWWFDLFPTLTLRVGGIAVPLFGSSTRRELVAIGRHFSRRSADLQLPQGERQLRLRLEHSLGGREVGALQLGCLLDAPPTTAQRVHVVTEFVYGEGRWRLALRTEAGCGIPGGEMVFRLGGEVGPSVRQENRPPKLMPPTPLDDVTFDDILRLLQRAYDAEVKVKDATNRWKGAGRLIDCAKFDDAVRKVSREMSAVDADLRRTWPPSLDWQVPNRKALESEVARFDAWIAGVPFPVKGVEQRHRSVGKHLQHCQDSAVLLRSRLRIASDAALRSLQAKLSTCPPVEWNAVAALLIATAPVGWPARWEELIRVFINQVRSAFEVNRRGPIQQDGLLRISQLVGSMPGLHQDCSCTVVEVLASACGEFLPKLRRPRDVRNWCQTALRLTALRNSSHDQWVHFAKTSPWEPALRDAARRVEFASGAECASLARYLNIESSMDPIEVVVGVLDGTGHAVELQVVEEEFSS